VKFFVFLRVNLCIVADHLIAVITASHVNLS
jgi:hypothetical protein